MGAFDHPQDPSRAPRDGLTCEIGWIDPAGNATYDLNPAIGRVRLPERVWQLDRFGNGHKTPVKQPATRWFAICACHAERLGDLNMADWEFDSWYGRADALYFRRWVR